MPFHSIRNVSPQQPHITIQSSTTTAAALTTTLLAQEGITQSRRDMLMFVPSYNSLSDPKSGPVSSSKPVLRPGLSSPNSPMSSSSAQVPSGFGSASDVGSPLSQQHLPSDSDTQARQRHTAWNPTANLQRPQRLIPVLRASVADIALDDTTK